MGTEKSMHVGIITWISYFNFGTFLQAYALQSAIHALGYENAIISDAQIIRPFHKKPSYFRRFLSGLHHLFLRNDSRFRQGMRSMKASYKLFATTYLNIDSCWNDFSELNDRYDVFVCGSDQIWSPVLPRSSYYYAGFTRKKKVAYAPSLGVKNCTEEWSEWVKPLLEQFANLSVREEDGAKLLQRFMGKPVSVVLDPTLLLHSEDWLHLIGHKRSENTPSYVLAYFLTDNPVYWKCVREFAHEKGLPVKAFAIHRRYLACADEALFVGPLDFLKQIRDADYFFTDSFHGSVFAIHFEKRFFALKRFKETEGRNQNSRIENLFSICGLMDYFLGEDELERISRLPCIDYVSVKQAIARERESSLLYLKTSLES